jgi:short-subunit dehydrogenase
MTVLATARRRDRLEAVAAELPSGRVLIAAGDLADAAFRDQLWSQAEALPGGLDLLINNAGLGRYSELALQDAISIRQTIEVNLMALIDLTQKALRLMRPRGRGEIVQISSILGFFGLPYSAAYVASKHAVNGLVKSLRYELRGTGVRVWAACPGRTESEFGERALGGEPKGPLPRGAATEKVARAIIRGLGRRRAFLVPNAAAWAPVALAHWLPGPFEWFMERWSAGVFAAEINRARHGSGRSPSAP